MTRHKDTQIEESRLRYGHNLDQGRFSTLEPGYDAEHRRERNENNRRTRRGKADDAEDSNDEQGAVDNGRDAGTDEVNRFGSHYDPSIAGPPDRDDYK